MMADNSNPEILVDIEEPANQKQQTNKTISILKTIWENIWKIILENKLKVVIGIGIFFIFLTTHIQIGQEFKGTKKVLTKLQLEVDQIVILNGSYERFMETKVYMAKTKMDMNFIDGLKACKKAGGYMFEYSESHPKYNSILANVISKYGINGFYVGLTKSDNVWTWVNGKRGLGHMDNVWIEGQPTNQKSENCAQVKKSRGKNVYGLDDIDCSVKSSIICIKRPN